MTSIDSTASGTSGGSVDSADYPYSGATADKVSAAKETLETFYSNIVSHYEDRVTRLVASLVLVSSLLSSSSSSSSHSVYSCVRLNQRSSQPTVMFLLSVVFEW